jgi:hypothetical protein
MKSTLELEQLTDSTIHSVILGFDPEVPETYRECVKVLEDLQRRIESSTVELSTKNSLLIRVKSHLALMASEVENHVEADQLATEVLGYASVNDPNFSFSVLIKTQALHALGRHEEEVRLGLEYAGSEGLYGHSLVYLLAELARRHPESIEWKSSLISRVKSYVSESPGLASRIRGAFSPEENPREYVLAVADTVRQISREKTARIFGDDA